MLVTINHTIKPHMMRLTVFPLMPNVSGNVPKQAHGYSTLPESNATLLAANTIPHPSIPICDSRHRLETIRVKHIVISTMVATK